MPHRPRSRRRCRSTPRPRLRRCRRSRTRRPGRSRRALTIRTASKIRSRNRSAYATCRVGGRAADRLHGRGDDCAGHVRERRARAGRGLRRAGKCVYVDVPARVQRVARVSRRNGVRPRRRVSCTDRARTRDDERVVRDRQLRGRRHRWGRHRRCDRRRLRLGDERTRRLRDAARLRAAAVRTRRERRRDAARLHRRRPPRRADADDGRTVRVRVDRGDARAGRVPARRIAARHRNSHARRGLAGRRHARAARCHRRCRRQHHRYAAVGRRRRRGAAVRHGVRAGRDQGPRATPGGCTGGAAAGNTTQIIGAGSPLAMIRLASGTKGPALVTTLGIITVNVTAKTWTAVTPATRPWEYAEVADVNGDGLDDLVTGGVSNDVEVLTQLVSQTAAPQFHQTVIPTPDAIQLVATGDFDGDHQRDVAMVALDTLGSHDGHVEVSFADSATAYSPVTTLATIDETYFVVARDVLDPTQPADIDHTDDVLIGAGGDDLTTESASLTYFYGAGSREMFAPKTGPSIAGYKGLFALGGRFGDGGSYGVVAGIAPDVIGQTASGVFVLFLLF